MGKSEERYRRKKRKQEGRRFKGVTGRKQGKRDGGKEGKTDRMEDTAETQRGR